MGRALIRLLSLSSVITALVVAYPTPAFPCGGDGDGGSGGSSSDGGGSSGGSDDSSSSEPSCINTTDIVGRSECHRFGDWDVSRKHPRVQFNLGSSVHFFSMAGMGFTGTGNHDPGIAYKVAGERMGSSGTATAGSFDMRVTTMLTRHLYTGGQFNLGRVAVLGQRPTNVGELTVDASSGLYFSLGAVMGAAAHSGDWTLRGEAQLGYRVLSLSVETRHLNCIDQSMTSDGQWQVRPRVVVERWLSPWFTAGASLSTDALRDGDYAAGVFVGGHVRAFDAGRSH